MKQTKKFLARTLTMLLVVMTLFSTVSVGFTASAATTEQPQEYTQEIDLGATSDEAPKGDAQVETPEKKPEASDSDDEGNLVAGEEIEIPVRSDKQDIADVGANVDVAGTGANQAPATVKYTGDLTGWSDKSGSSWTFNNVEAGTYEFKVRDADGNWYGNNGTMNETSSGWDFWDDCNNCKFKLGNDAAKVVFKWSSQSMSVTVYYNVVWKNGDGSTLETDSVKHGGSATCSKTPTKASTAQYSYTHSGWDKSASSVKSNLTITPTFSSSVRSYKITTSVSGSGSVTGGGTYEYGTSVTLKATAGTGYNWSKWSGASTSTSSSITITVKEDATYTANFTKKSYTVTFKDWDGTVLKTQSVKYKEAATAPSDPTRDSTAQYSYTFNGWDKSFSSITGNTTVTATYTATVRSYTVTFKDDAAVGGGTLKTQTVEYGSGATAPSVSAKDGWEFFSWGGTDFSNITGNLTVTAVRSNKNVQLLGDGNIGGWSTGTSRRMTYNSDGTSTKTVKLPAGKYELKIYTEEWGEWLGNSGTVNDSCSGWDMGSGNNLTLNASGGNYTFTFNRNTKKLSISFSAIKYTVTPAAGTGGSASADYTSVNLGGTSTLTAKPSKGYHFKSWTIGSNGEIVNGGSTSSNPVTIKVSGNVTGTANFAGNAGTVKYVTGDNGNVSNAGSHSVTYPNAATSKATPATGYSFSKWTISGGTQGTDWDFTSGSTTSASIGIKVYTAGKTITATASFTANTSSIEFKTSTGGTVSNTGATNVTYPATKASTATPSYGYNFSKWTITGGTAGTDYKITAGGTDQASITIQPLTAGKTIVATANFTKKNYTVTIGTATGGSAKADATSVTFGGTTSITATASYGYKFSKWNITSTNSDHASTLSSTTENPVTVTVNCNCTVTPVFEKLSYTVTLDKTPSAGGTVKTDSTSVKYQESTTITATPAEGYSFSKWEITSGTGTLANANKASTTLTVESNVTVKATFTIAVYTVNFRDHADFGGEIVATQYIEHGSNASTPSSSLISPEKGWEFYSWGDASAYQNVKKDLDIYAVRSNKNVQLLGDGNIGGWTVADARRMTYNSNGTSTKTVKLPKGTYGLKIYTEEWGNWHGNNGTVVDTTDTTASAGWDMDGGNNLTLQASGGNYTFTYYRNTNKLKITFSPIKYSVSVSSSPEAGGTTTITQTSVHYGDTTTLKATAKPGYTFSKWTFTGSPDIKDGSATSATVTIMPNKATTATAVFTANTATVQYGATSGGSVTNMGDNSVTYPNEVKSTATANPGYTFTGWTIKGGTKGTDYDISTGSTDSATIGIKVYKKGATITATANFSANSSTVKFVAGEGGTVDKAGSHNILYPNTIQATATASGSHNFSSWTISGGTAGKDYKITAGGTNQNTITIQPISGATITVTANFTIKTYTVTFENWDGSELNKQTVSHGSDAIAPANPTRPSTAKYDYTFKSWDKGFTNITSDLTVTATYTESIRSYTVTFKDYDGDVLKTETVKYGSGATAPSDPSRTDGWIFDKWDKDYSNITGDTTVTAVYWDNNVYLAGTFTAWEANSSSKMSYGTVSSMTLNLNEGNYEFKFIFKGSWKGNNGEVVNTTDVNGNSNSWETYDGNNIRLKAIGGKYTFTFNKETNRFEVKHTPITYTVKFYDEGKLLSTQTVKRGEDAKAPANPSKAADAQYTYTFSGWDKSYTGVRSNLDINSVYTKTVNKYVVTFKDYNGTILDTQNVEYGSAAKAPADPTREGYTFTGWDKDFSNITGALTVTAQYGIDTYTVKFVNWDGSVLSTQQVEYGQAATAPATNPTRPADAQYTYAFKGWDKGFNKITGNTTITATYTETLNSYTVKFVNWDGKVYKTQTVEYGKAATAPSNPSRNDGWTFIGWDSEAYKNVTGDLTITAQWRDNNVYLQGVTGTWNPKASGTKMSYGNVSVMSLELAAGTYEFKLIYGEDAELNPTWYGNGGEIADTTETSSPGLGWEMSTSAGNCKLIATGGTYTFKFNKNTKYLIVEYFSNALDVTFKDYDGTVLATAKVEEGKTAESVAPADPTRNATAQYTYTFAGWTPSIKTAITADTTFTATYTETTNRYTVTFENWDGTLLGTSTVDYGTAAAAPADPTRDADPQYTYTFSGWDKDFSNVTSNITVKAQYATTVNKYDITFKYVDADGKTNRSQLVTVEYGKAANAPEIPTRTDGWVFTGWDKDFSFITGTLTVTAQYRNDNVYLNGAFFDGWAYNKAMTKNGDVYTYSTSILPGKYQFKINQNVAWYGNSGIIDDTTDTTSATGWDMNTDAGNCTLNASGGTYTFIFNNSTKKLIVKYEPTTYTVKFFDWDGTQLGETQTIAIGKPATAPAEPTRESTVSHDFTFSGWSEDFSSVTKDMDIVAQYTETLRKYTVIFSFVDADGVTEKTETQQVDYGTAATAPTLPVRSDGYGLRKWDKDFSNITGDLTVKAEYFNDNVYLRGTFNNWDKSTILQTYGNNTVSTRVELAPGTYEFKFYHDDKYYTDGNAGTVGDTTGEYWWSTNTSQQDNTKLNATGGYYTFTWNVSEKSFNISYEPYMYTVTFVDEDGTTVLDKQQVAIGTSAIAPATPTRTDGWVFDKWDTDFSNVTGDLTVKAVYYDNNVYLMGINGDWTTTNANNRLTNKGTQNVVELTLEIGKTAGDTFTQSQHEFKFKQHNTWYTYRPISGSSKVINDSTMSSWYSTSTNEVDNNNTILNASGGKYTFKFATDTKDFNIHYDAIKYEVIFYDYAQNVLKKEMVEIGKGATAPEVPTRTNGFKFLKWDKDFSCITDRTEVYARYYDDKLYLSGDFNNWGTTALATYGDKIQSTTMVLEPGSYSFNFFHNEPVNGEAVRHYHTDINNGTFENETTSENDGWWDTKKADGGQTTLISTGGIYTFYYNTETNQFKVTYTPNVFDVTFVYYDEEGKTLIEDVQDVKLGEDAIAPEVPVRKDGWVFDKWDKEFTDIQGDLRVVALYIDENIYFTASFNNWNEKATPFKLTENENVVKLTLEYTPGEYEFKIHKGDGWYSFDGTISDKTTSALQFSSSVQNNAKLKATGGYYTFTYNKANDTLEVSYEPYVYTVTFVDYDGTVLKTEKVEITKAATAPADPVRNDGWVFTGWDMMFDNIQADLTVKAQYKDDNVYLMGIDKGWTKEDCNIMKSSDGNTATYTIRNVSGAATFEFKFLYEDVWYTDVNAGTVDNSTEDSWWSTTDNQSVGNTKLSAAGGSYVITFNKTDKTFKVEHKPNIYEVTFKYYGKTGFEPITTIVQVEAGGDVELPALEERTDRWFYLFWAENVGGEPYGTRYTQTITNVTQDMEIQAWYFDDNAYLIGNVVDGQWIRTQENMLEVYDFEKGTSSKTIHLDPGQYDFRVIHRHDGSMNDYKYGNNGTIPDECYNWDMSTADNNCVLNASGGTYTFTFDRITKRLSVSYVPDYYTVTFVDEDGTTVLKTQQVASAKSAEAPDNVVQLKEGNRKFQGWDKDFSKVYSDLTVQAIYFDDNYYLSGSFNNWTDVDAMGPYGEETVTIGKYLEPGTYTFKIHHNTSSTTSDWFGSNAVIDNATDGTIMNIDSDCTLNASGGYYIFKYTPSTNTLVIVCETTTFKVVFKDWDGTLLDTQTVTRGNAAKAPEGLTREGDAQYSYEFIGWDKDISNVQSDLEVTAQYLQVVNKYKVTFVYYTEDGQTKTSTDVMTEYGTAAVAPEIPARTDGWVHSGWDKDFSNITGDLTVEALYINANVFLAGTFNGWSETSLPMMPTGNFGEFSTTIVIHHGESHEFKFKHGDKWYGNNGTFTDTTDEDGNPNPWQMNQTTDTSLSNCHINTTGGYYTFIFNVNTQKMEVKYEPFVYTVNFYDYNDVLLHTEQVDITKSATAPEAPVRGGGFIFKGWSTNEYEKVMKNLDVYAKYYDDNLYLKGSFNEWGTENMFTKYGDNIVSTTIELEPGKYTFKIFKEAENDGELWYSAPSETIVDSTDWKQSEDASSLGDTILIANGGYYTFYFNHETKQFKIDYKPYKYEVTFIYKEMDGVTDKIETQIVDRNQAAVAPNVSTTINGFVFSHWDKDFSCITENITVTAHYYDDNLYILGSFNNWTPSEAYKLNPYTSEVSSARIELAPGQYDFKFYRNDVYYTDFESATFQDKTDSAQATKTDGANSKLNATGGWYTFEFNKGNQQFTIAYEPYIYTVRFLDWDGSVIGEPQQIEISKDAVAPADPTREGYTFTGWDKVFTNVQGNLDINATYEINKFQVTFVYFTSDGKQISETQTVDWGTAAKAPELPTRQDGMAFKNWDKDFSYITEDIIVTAEYFDDNVYLLGIIDGWTPSDNNRMELTDDPNVVILKIRGLNEGSYEFKLKRDKNWYGNNGQIENTTDEDGHSNPWDMATTADNCILNATGGDYTFIYNKKTQKLEVKYTPYTYIVEFVDWDGTVIKTENVEIGKDATPPANPTRPDDEYNTYTFAGWEGDYLKVKADTTVKALYTSVPRQLTVTFKNWDGTILKEELVDRGADATPPTETPVKEGNAQYKYTFNGWDPDYTNVQSDLVVTATFVQVTNKYTVTFVDYDGDVIDTQEVEYGMSATAPADPTREYYLFTGWDGDFSNVTEDITIKATYVDNRVYLMGDFNSWKDDIVMTQTGENTYEKTINLDSGSDKFKIYHLDTWYGNNGTINDTTDENGISNPWKMEESAGNCTLNATGGVYKFIYNTETQKLEVKHILEKFTVVFYDAAEKGGDVLKIEEVEYGKSATAPDDPLPPAGKKFAGWDADFSVITGNISITAVYVERGAQYEVIFVNKDGTELSRQTVEAGTAAIAPEDPTFECDTVGYHNVFTGWDKSFTNVVEDMVITAQYEMHINTYTVRFVDWDGTLLAERSDVEYGSSAQPPQNNPTRDGYIFNGWDKDYTVITPVEPSGSTIIITAQYVQDKGYTVKFYDWNNTLLAAYTQTVKAGQAAIDPVKTNPSIKDGILKQPDSEKYTYEFAGWDQDFSNVISDMEIKPIYNESLRKFTVTFRNDDKSLIGTAEVLYGHDAIPPYIPTKDPDANYIYEFAGWSPSIKNVTQDMTVYAYYNRNPIKVRVEFYAYGDLVYSNYVSKGSTITPPNGDNYARADHEFVQWNVNGSKASFYITGPTRFDAVFRNPNVYIGGASAGIVPSQGAWEKMTLVDKGDQVYSYQVKDLAPGNYYFKYKIYSGIVDVNEKEVPYGRDIVVPDTTGGTYWDSSTAEGFITLSATGGGTYTFYFDKDAETFKVEWAAPKYTVTFKDHDGTVLTTETVDAGTAATPPSVRHSEPDENGMYYEFIQWDNQSYKNVTRDLVITAVCEERYTYYTVTFVGHNNAPIESQQVKHGEDAVAPAAPTLPNYTFIGWDKPFTNVTSNLTVKAQYQGNEYKITVSASDGGSASTSTDKVNYNNPVTLTANANSGNNFKRWDIKGSYTTLSGSTSKTQITIIPTSDIVAVAYFGEGVNLTVYSYSTSGYEWLYIEESNGSNTSYPAGSDPGREQANEEVFHGVTWKKSDELALTNGYYASVIANLTNGLSGTPTGEGNIVIFNNVLGWSEVHLFTSATDLWNGDNGCTTVGATHYTMSRISGTNYWYVYIKDDHRNILFMSEDQSGYTNIYNTTASYRSDYDSAYPTFTPNTTSNQSTNGTNYYSNGSWSAVPSLSEKSEDFDLTDTLYQNGTWAGVSKVWLYENGSISRITLRSELLELIDTLTPTYNGGVNPDNKYTADSWADFVNAYQNAQDYAGKDSSTQKRIDEAQSRLQAAYEALKEQSYIQVIVKQSGAIGTVVVNDTTVIETKNGSAAVDFNSNATISIHAPQYYYITSITVNGITEFSNANQAITATSITLNSLIANAEIEVHYERKLEYTITVYPYDVTGGTLYYGDVALNYEGDIITVFAGESATITAVANDGYVLGKWVIDKTGEFFKSAYTFSGVKSNHTIAVEWKAVQEITVSVATNPGKVGNATATSGNSSATTDGTGSSSMKIDQYDTITLTAVATDPLYIFESWEITGDYYAADSTTRFDETFNIIATGDILATAKFREAYRKIYLENDANWDECYLYFWGSDLETDEWPGTKMTYDPEIDLWYGYIPYDTTDIQFNDGTNANKVEFSDVTPNLYNNANGFSGIYVEKGYYLQGQWNGENHDANSLHKFKENEDGTYSITITVTQTGDGYIYVNPTNELSEFWNAEFNGKTDNPQYLTFIGEYTETPNQVKVEIDPDDFDADYDVTFTFNPETGEFSWTAVPKVPTITIIGTDGRGTNSSDSSMITDNNRVGDTYFDVDTVISTKDLLSAEKPAVYAGMTASVIAGTPVTFYTQVNPNVFGKYDYYVYGWVINGTEFVFATSMGNGLYSGVYTFTDDKSTVVPVYFHTAEWLAANKVEQTTVYAVIDKNIENWDKYISVYTWYNTSENVTDYDQYGPYPGQLMIPVAGLDGVYYTFVELQSPAGTPVSGIVFGNYAPNVYTENNVDTVAFDTLVVDYKAIQTYDYYDFIALLEDGKDNITFVVKNTNDKYNSKELSEGNNVTLKDYNFVQYTDYSGIKTDIFGQKIESIYSTLLDSNALYIIQAGDKPKHEGVLQGDHYVQCFIYDATGKYLGSCFSYELHDKDSALWTGILAPYKNQRVYFSYEAMNGNRYDGEWYGDSGLDIKVNVSVNVGLRVDGNITINTTNPVNIATYGEGYVNATLQNVDAVRGTTVTLTAVPAKGYKFVGWFTKDGELFSTNVSYVATVAIGTTYTAVFEELDRNNFYVNHYIYTGVGTTSSYIPNPHGGKAQLYVGIQNVTMGVETPLAPAESAFVPARIGDKLIITIATDALGADKFFAWYVAAKDRFGLTSFEEVGVNSYDNIASNPDRIFDYNFTRYNNNGDVIGRNDIVYFQFEYTVKADTSEGAAKDAIINSMTLYSDLLPISAQVILEYKYNDMHGNVKTYYVPYNLTSQEIEGFAGNNFTPYTPAYISGDSWTNTILAHVPFVDDLKKDTTWVINKAMYDPESFVLWATQPETLYTVTSQIGDTVVVVQKNFGEVCNFNVTQILGDKAPKGAGFWYNDVNNNGKYDKDIDIILTYGTHYGYRVTRDMNINFDVMDKYDFNIFIDEPEYGREQSSNSDGSNKVDRVNTSFVTNILTPYFYDGKEFVPNPDNNEVNGAHVTIDTLRNMGYTITHGMIVEQVGSFMPGTDKYPTFEDALKAAQEKNYGVATDYDILLNEVITGYKKPVITSTGTYCKVYDTTNYSISNKNRYMFTLSLSNTEANQKKFYNVYSYVTITTPDGVTTTYISNVQTLNIYTTGTTDTVVNSNASVI